MNKKGVMSGLVLAFVGVLVVATLLVVPQELTDTATNLTQSLEQVTLLQGENVALTNIPVNTCLLANHTNGTQLATTTHFTCNEWGITATAAVENATTWNVSYYYEPSGYISGTANTLVSYIPLFAVLFVIAFIIGLIMKR